MTKHIVFSLSMTVFLQSCNGSSPFRPPIVSAKDVPESKAGERLFREFRFSEHYTVKSMGNANAILLAGEEALATLETMRGPVPGPFRSEAQSCVTCHMIDDAMGARGPGMRSYADFSQQSAIAVLGDGHKRTLRNSPSLVNASIPRAVPTVWHFDGEFASLEELVLGSFSGRNFGWYPEEKDAALNQLVDVIKFDDGSAALAKRFGGLPYAALFAGDEANVPPSLLLPAQYRIDVASAPKEVILANVASLVAIYVRSLEFATDDDGRNIGSPYDAFLMKNDLPRLPAEGESEAAYAARLAWAVAKLVKPQFVGKEGDGEFEFHQQEFEFGKEELKGLKIFLARQRKPTAEAPGAETVGNCVSCHPPPHFSDFRFHNTGATQDEYDAIHGEGTFMAIKIPSLEERGREPARFLPPSAEHPRSTGQFSTRPSSDTPESVDLGLWNVFANPFLPKPQAAISQILCGEPSCDAHTTLPATIALFKTPGLRDLGHSDPYLHTGKARTIEDVLRFYIRSAERARIGALRNLDPEIARISISDADVRPLAAFLRALNEDYE